VRSCFVGLTLVLLTGCSLTAYEGNENSPYYLVPVGSRVTLHQELPVEPNLLGVFIQNGKIIKSAETLRYYPYCKLELFSLSEVARKIAPDEFEITKTVQDENLMTYREAGPDTVAASTYSGGMRRRILSDAGGDAGGPTLQPFATRMDLKSAKQPDAFRLICSR